MSPRAGLQSALMAPTEILARQHYETLAAPLASRGIERVLLTGRDKGAARAEKLAALAGGSAAVAVGTHALFQDDVVFHALALTVIDEQHRFGVDERARLQAKGEAAHLSAGDVGDADPAHAGADRVRRPRRLADRREAARPHAGGDPRRADAAGRRDRRRACATAVAAAPRRSGSARWSRESENADLAAAEARARGAAAGVRRARRPGARQLPAPEKDAVMAEFADGALAVLVATTVVEVGVDVPDADHHGDRAGRALRPGAAAPAARPGRARRGARAPACCSTIRRCREIAKQPARHPAAHRRRLRHRREGSGAARRRRVLGPRQSGIPGFRLAEGRTSRR